MNFIPELGDHVDEICRSEHEQWVKQQQVLVNNNDADAMAKLKLRNQCQRPSVIFLTLVLMSCKLNTQLQLIRDVE